MMWRARIFGVKTDGCDNHHFGEWEETDELRSREKGLLHDEETGENSYVFTWTRPDWLDSDRAFLPYLSISRKHVRTCQHYGCSETDEKWKEEYVLPVSEADSWGRDAEDFREDPMP